jgi:hypothetical protein
MQREDGLLYSKVFCAVGPVGGQFSRWPRAADTDLKLRHLFFSRGVYKIAKSDY